MADDTETIRQSGDSGRTPVPDPTVLTTQQLVRVVADLKELFATRWDGMDKAINLLQSNADKSPSIAVVDQKLTDAIELMNGKFAERDVRVEQSARDVKAAVDNAFNAQKEAIAKAEAGFTKQIDSIGGQLGQIVKTLDDKIADIKDRFNGLSNQQVSTVAGITGKEEGSKAVWITIGAAIGALGALVPIIALLMTFLGKSTP